MRLYKFFVLVLVTVFILVQCQTITVLADETQIATEYMSEDLTEPLDGLAVSANAAVVPEITTEYAVLIEQNTGEVLYEKNSHERLSPASVTKVMSLLLVMEAIEEGKLSFDTVVTTSEYAASMGGSQIWLEPGESMTVDELLKAAVIASANDATTALAEAVSGSVEGFVNRMNDRAKELGLNDCKFINPTGLDAENHYMSPYDIAVISAELLKHEDIKKYSTVWMDTLRGGQTSLVNTNKLVRFYDGTTGLKTGTTSAAGCCLAASAQRDGLSVIAVVMKSESSNVRFNDARKLLDFAFANYSFKTVSVDKENLKPVKVASGMNNYAEVNVAEDAKLLLPKGSDEKLSQEILMNDNITAPVKVGDVVGVCQIKYNGEVVKEIEIMAAEEVESIKFTLVFKKMLLSIMIF